MSNLDACVFALKQVISRVYLRGAPELFGA